MLKTRLTTLCVVFPILTACGGNSLQVESEHVSNEKIAEIKANIESLYPDADKELKQHILEVAVKSIDDMVFIEGGSFMMGDFLAPCDAVDSDKMIWTPEAACISSYTSYDTGAIDLHKVTLTSYSLSKYETTYFEFDAFRLSNGLKVIKHDKRVTKSPESYPIYYDYPTPLKNWQEAKDYCSWVAKLTDLPFDLPTEAQWEYAARNQGKNVYYATNDGSIKFEEGALIGQDGSYHEYTQDEINFENDYQKVGLLPPNPLGLYDMTGNTSEVVNDWYSPDYYKSSPEYNPQGPETGKIKSRRDLRGDKRFVTTRGYFESQTKHMSSFGFRCSLQQSTPI